MVFQVLNVHQKYDFVKELSEEGVPWGICGTVAILDNVEGVCTFNF